jgi:hypothetical protein
MYNPENRQRGVPLLTVYGFINRRSIMQAIIIVTNIHHHAVDFIGVFKTDC